MPRGQVAGPVVPRGFRPPIVKREDRGIAAFQAYDWYFRWLKYHLAKVSLVFLVPCAETKPIHFSPLHRVVYQKFAKIYGRGREVLVVSEPVVLIRYQDLYDLEPEFCYDFPPKLLGREARELFVARLREALPGKKITGCLPQHHASLVNDAIGSNWVNYWRGDLYSMMRRAGSLKDLRKMYRVLKDGKIVESKVPGRFAGYRPGKIFGRLDCKSGMRMKKGNRVFFLAWEDAIASGYRPCKNCKPTPLD